MESTKLTKEQQLDFMQSNMNGIVELAGKFERFLPSLLDMFEEYRINAEKYQIQPDELQIASKFVEEQLLPMLDFAEQIAAKYAKDNNLSSQEETNG